MQPHDLALTTEVKKIRLVINAANKFFFCELLVTFFNFQTLNSGVTSRCCHSAQALKNTTTRFFFHLNIIPFLYGRPPSQGRRRPDNLCTSKSSERQRILFSKCR